MTTPLPISAFIITLNEEERIADAINSVKSWVDEIIVVDSGSSDNTVAICESLGAKVIHHDFEGYGQQKRFAEDQCAHDWLLNLDADERVTPELRTEIEALFASGTPEKDGYYLPMVSRFITEKPRFNGWYKRIVHYIRLYNRTKGRYADSTVHDTVRMEPHQTAKLRGEVIHITLLSVEHAIMKLNRYSTMQAEDMLSHKRTPSILRLYVDMPLSELRRYFLQGYFLRGHSGFIYSITFAFSRFARLAKQWEMQELASRKERDDV